MRTLALTLLLSLMASAALAQQPTEQHQMLTKWVGKQSGQMKIWQQPDADPIMVPFTETNSSVLGGLWVATEFQAGPYQGRGMSGYDPVKKKYIGTWANNMSPHLALMEGEYDEAAAKLTMHSTDLDPASGKVVDTKSVTTFTEKGPQMMTMYKKDAESGEFVKMFEMVYEARKE